MNVYSASVPQLNYHHLRYFWIVARERNLTRAARRLNVSASAVSTQLRGLESALGAPLFSRSQKQLALTEAGRIAFDYAETIFRAGDELLDSFSKSAQRARVVRIGAMATLSRNFQMEFIRPLLALSDVEIVLRSGNLRDLLPQLEAYALDIFLATEQVRSEGGHRFDNHLIAEYPVSLVCSRKLKVARSQFPGFLRHVPLVLPGPQSTMREPFDAILAKAGIKPHVVAEADDMALLRLLAREGAGVTLVPPIAVQDELRSGELREICQVPNLRKAFFAVTLQRQFPNALVRELIATSGGKRKFRPGGLH